MTDGQSASLSWNKAPIWGLRPDFYYCQTVSGLLICGALAVTRGQVFRLQLLLALANAVILSQIRVIESESYITTNGQSASLSWNKAPIWGLRPDFYYCQTVSGLLICGALAVTRGPVCRLQLLLALANAVILSQIRVTESKSYIMTDGQSASLYWNKAPIWAYGQIFITVRQLRVCWCGAFSLTGGRVCHLQLLLALARAVIFGS
jgi:hypothetical protein